MSPTIRLPIEDLCPPLIYDPRLYATFSQPSRHHQSRRPSADDEDVDFAFFLLHDVSCCRCIALDRISSPTRGSISGMELEQLLSVDVTPRSETGLQSTLSYAKSPSTYPRRQPRVEPSYSKDCLP